MLKLTVRKDSKIYLQTLDGEIEVDIQMLSKEQARIGFRAPRSVSILRGEVRDRDRIARYHAENRGNV